MKRLFSPTKIQPMPAGVYHRQSTAIDQPPYRIHLRLQADGSGILVLNASTVMHLNPDRGGIRLPFRQGHGGQAVAREVACALSCFEGHRPAGFRGFRGSHRDAAFQPGCRSGGLPGLRTGYATLSDPDCSIARGLRPHVPSARGRRSGLCTLQSAWTANSARQNGSRSWTSCGRSVCRTSPSPAASPRSATTWWSSYVTRRPPVRSAGCSRTASSWLIAATCVKLLMSGLDHILMILHPRPPESWRA